MSPEQVSAVNYVICIYSTAKIHDLPRTCKTAAPASHEQSGSYFVITTLSCDYVSSAKHNCGTCIHILKPLKKKRKLCKEDRQTLQNRQTS